jgi:hypothetical protein
MKTLNKILTIIMIIIFPLGIIYCVGKNLFNGNFASFIGGILLFVMGFVLAIFLLRPDLVEPIISFINKVV